MVFKNHIQYLVNDLNTIIENQIKSMQDEYLNDTSSISQANKNKIMQNIDKEMQNLKEKINDRMTIASQEHDRKESNDVIFLTSNHIKSSVQARTFVAEVIKKDPNVDGLRVSVSSAVEMPKKGKDGKTTFKVNLPPKTLVAMPGKDYTKSLTQIFMQAITKDNKLLTVENGDSISVARQVPKYLMPKKKELDQIAYEVRKIGKSDKNKGKKSKFQTKVNYVANINDMVFKIKKRDEKDWIIVEREGNKDLGKEISDRMKKIESTHLINEKEIIKKIMM